MGQGQRVSMPQQHECHLAKTSLATAVLNVFLSQRDWHGNLYLHRHPWRRPPSHLLAGFFPPDILLNPLNSDSVTERDMGLPSLTQCLCQYHHGLNHPYICAHLDVWGVNTPGTILDWLMPGARKWFFSFIPWEDGPQRSKQDGAPSAHTWEQLDKAPYTGFPSILFEIS